MTAKRVDEALKAAGVATGLTNIEVGKRVAAEQQRDAERQTSDERLVEIVELRQDVAQLRRRTRTWVVIVITIAAAVVGGIGTGIAVSVAPRS